MRWLVEITDITDKRFLSDLLAKGKDRLFLEENRFYLISDGFESLSTCSKVWEKANEIRSIIVEISLGLGADISFRLSTVYEQKEDGSRHGTVVATGQPGLLTISAEGGTWTLNPPISAEEKLRLEAERLEREYQEKLALVSSRLLLVLQNERALEVHRLLQQEQTPVCMGHIIDLIKNDLGGKEELKNFVSCLFSIKGKNLVDRFYYSINSPKAFGYASRHILEQSKNEKLRKNRQPNLMYSDEAKLFVSNIADLWFKRKCAGEDNV
jgi:hypothetical protein